MSVSNEEHLEEVLFEAHAYGVRLEVIPVSYTHLTLPTKA